MKTENFFKDPRLPFAECRYSCSSVQSFRTHIHRSFSIGAVDRGRVSYQVGDEQTTLTVGALALINPEKLHSCNPLDPEGRSYYMLYLDVDWCLRVQQSLWDVDAFVETADIKIDDASLYYRYCETMRRVMDAKVHLLEKEQKLAELISRVFQRACSPQERRPEHHVNIDYLRHILGMNLRDDVSLESVARRIEANPYTLLRQFKAATGVTPHAYRMNCRIEKARKHLQQGMSIAETAVECGFFDQSHMHRHFKAMTTVTPREYRVNFVQ